MKTIFEIGQRGESLALLILAPLWICTGCSSPLNDTPAGSAMSIELASSAFQPKGTIPKQYTGDGDDRSPPLHWSEPPNGTQSLALICEDPDAPAGTWVHWVLLNVPAEARELKEGAPTSETLPSGAKEG